ncbi:hypothetical protein Ddc_05927 [Ditylenchus destructor]|nr:hypothetical protein Ddc_05927 [Ditylenchus destructor]
MTSEADDSIEDASSPSKVPKISLVRNQSIGGHTTKTASGKTGLYVQGVVPVQHWVHPVQLLKLPLA